jgi:hypothetical protein
LPYSCRGDGDAKDDASASSRDGSYVTEWTDLDVPPEPEHEPEHVSERTFENAFAGVDVLGDRYK